MRIICLSEGEMCLIEAAEVYVNAKRGGYEVVTMNNYNFFIDAMEHNVVKLENSLTNLLSGSSPLAFVGYELIDDEEDEESIGSGALEALKRIGRREG